MLKTWAALFCVSNLIPAVSDAACSHIAPLGMGMASTDEVVSSVECVVQDPGRLRDDLGIEVGQRLLVETLNDQVSSIFVDGDPIMTAFPAALEFSDRGFEMVGRESHADGDAWLNLSVQGRLLAPPCAGRMKMEYIDAASNYRALVRLGACHRVR